MSINSTTIPVLASRLDLLQVSSSISTLPRVGAVACPCLNVSEAKALVSVVDQLEYRPAKAITGSDNAPVYQDFDLCYDVPSGHSLWEFAQVLEQALTSALAGAEVDSECYPLRLNDLIVQRYPPGCAGITPHRDHVRYGFLIAIILLTGDGYFGVCDDRQGNESREIDFKPGDLLLMGGPGLIPNFRRPFHFVNGVTDWRRTIGLRYDTHKSDA
ncbi:uncharacterized protein METZ01_LOCUS69348 [marine metagenome]|uniref:Fe2OG dioxygenase domain-containing protein n=1 Tax=marine metagenome TaxID=408172 RepID=A0A381TL32_9ZZZZ